MAGCSQAGGRWWGFRQVLILRRRSGVSNEIAGAVVRQFESPNCYRGLFGEVANGLGHPVQHR